MLPGFDLRDAHLALVLQNEIDLKRAVLLRIVVKRIPLRCQGVRRGVLHQHAVVGERIAGHDLLHIPVSAERHQDARVAQVHLERIAVDVVVQGRVHGQEVPASEGYARILQPFQCRPVLALAGALLLLNIVVLERPVPSCQLRRYRLKAGLDAHDIALRRILAGIDPEDGHYLIEALHGLRIVAGLRIRLHCGRHAPDDEISPEQVAERPVVVLIDLGSVRYRLFHIGDQAAVDPHGPEELLEIHRVHPFHAGITHRGDPVLVLTAVILLPGLQCDAEEGPGGYDVEAAFG